MKIAIDRQIFIEQEYGGISRYFCSLVTHLATQPGMEARIIAPFHKNAYLEQLPRSLKRGFRVRPIPRTGRILRAAGHVLAAVALARFHPDIVHETYYSSVSRVPRGTPCVLTVYDVIHEKYPSMFPDGDKTSERKRDSVLRADHVICISEQTRRDLLQLIDVPGRKVTTVHLGVDVIATPPDPADAPPLSPEGPPYLLYVGSRVGYKNFKRFLRAYASSGWLCRNFRIVCFGGGTLRTDERALMAELHISDRQVEQVGGGDMQLARYYRNAVAFVYPSLYEGFGIPPLEAMSLGCPVICSNTSSIPEVVGDAGQYFEPMESESIQAAIEAVLQSPEKRDCLVREGAKRHRQFSWERCARETASIYGSLA